MYLFQHYLRLAGYNIKSASKELNKSKSLSSHEFCSWQDKKKWSIAKHHYENNKYYRKLVGNKFPDTWEKLPIIEKKDFQYSLERMISDGYKRKDIYIANTSGSSGHPFFFAKDKFSHSMTWIYIFDRYKDLGIGEGSREARFYGIPFDFVSYSKEKLKDYIMNRVRFPIFDLSDDTLNKFLNKFRRNKFIYVYGYTNSIVLFSKYLVKYNIDINKICPSLKMVIVTSELCVSDDRKIIAKAFRIPIVSEYGASEFGYIGIEVKPELWKVASELLYAENDSNGSLIITDLYNKAFPFVRYNIGDIGTIKSSGDGYQYIYGLHGRMNDNIHLPSGKISPGLTFYYISRSILESTGVLKEFIIRQTSLENFVFDIISDRPINEQEIDDIKKNMDRYLEPGLKVAINNVKKIHRPKSDKIKHFYSEIKN